MPELRLQLLGRFKAEDEAGNEIASIGRRGAALLAYLALGPDRPQSREKLATLLWADRPDDQARHSLRQALVALRRSLNDENGHFLIAQGESISLNRSAIEVDVHAFERLAAEKNDEAVERALTLYRGELLDGFSVRSDEFEFWLSAERLRLRDVAAAALERRLARQAKSEETELAIETAKRLLTLDPTRESTHRTLMQLYDRSGRRSMALRQFQTCRDVIRQELAAEPEPDTVRLFAEIRERQADPDRVPSVTKSKGDAPTPLSAATTESSEGDDVSQSARHRGARMRWQQGRWLWPTVAAAGLAVIIALSVLYFRPGRLGTTAETAGKELPLPDRPSIAILPFENLSDDRTQDNLVDALTADVTTGLSIVSGMFVIDRNSVLNYRGKPVKPSQVAEALGVRYVLIGSVQRSGDRIRISVELIDTLAGDRLWTDRYDREVKDLFALQDEITLSIITALQVHITEGEQERISLVHGTHNLHAWMLAGHGLQLLRHLTRADTERARELYQEAMAADPNYPGAIDGLAWTYLLEVRFGWSESPEADVKMASELAQKALALDPMRSRTYALLGIISLTIGDHAEATAYGEKAVALDPNGAENTVLFAYTLTYAGDSGRAIELVTKAMRLSPYYPDWYRWVLGRAYRLSGRYREAEATLTTPKGAGQDSVWRLVELVATYSEAGRPTDAHAAAAKLLEIDPAFSVRAWTKTPVYLDPAISKREIDALQRAGLPE
jgi:TolB-like protein/DNA-binding SARP family transcriptional activator